MYGHPPLMHSDRYFLATAEHQDEIGRHFKKGLSMPLDELQAPLARYYAETSRLKLFFTEEPADIAGYRLALKQRLSASNRPAA
jgi:hypothetical protein